MTVIIPDGFAQITFNWGSATFDTGKAATVFGLSIDEVGLLEVVGDLHTAWDTWLKPEQSTEVSLDNITAVTHLTIRTLVVGTPGERTGATPPPNVCMLAKLGTGLRGPQFRGRWYPPGFLKVDDVADSGALGVDRRSDLQTAWSGFVGAVVSDGSFPIVILHNSSDTEPTEVSSLEVEAKVATQQRRLR